MPSSEDFYGLAAFKKGQAVRIADRRTLEEFLRSWKLHHPLTPEQIEHADQVANIVNVQMYHGGDILYELENVSGTWHQRLLSST